MSAGLIKKVHSGDPMVIPASMYNSMVDLVNQSRGGKLAGGAAASQTAAPAGQVLIRNDSGADRARYDILGIDGLVFTPDDGLENFHNRVTLKGSTPTEAHKGKFVILAEPAAAGELARAYISGLCPVQLKIGSADHKYADIAASQSGYLATAETGAAQILYAADTSGTVWGVVRFGAGESFGSGWTMKKQYRLKLTPATTDGSVIFDSRDWRERLIHCEIQCVYAAPPPITPEKTYMDAMSSTSVLKDTLWCGNDIGSAPEWIPLWWITFGLPGFTFWLEIEKSTGRLRFRWQNCSALPDPTWFIGRFLAMEPVPSDDFGA
ncbi:MAG: hypothetical protein ABFD92_07900 [Planctomycetaceae bacterium]|nr:hypothetical protein [Planctomycetaceae bacterium]